MPLKVCVVLLSLAGLLCAPLIAQQVAPSNQDQPAKSPDLPNAKNKPTPPAANAQGVKEAEALLEKMAAAYRAAPAMTDTVTFESKALMGMSDFTLALGKGTDASASVQGFSFTAFGDQVYIVLDANKEKYVKTPLKQDLGTTLQDMFGGGAPLPPHFTFRSEGVSTNAMIKSLAMGMLEEPRIVDHAMTKSAAGDNVHQIHLWGDGGSIAQVHVDPTTHLVSSIDFALKSEGALADSRMQIKASMSPQIQDALKEPIKFDAGTRTAVASLNDLMSQEEDGTIKVGTAAPDFTLKTPAGEEVTLSALKGNVVVLDFWATWCPPCKKALPFLQEFATWAESSGKPIKVYAVDVWEKGSDAAARNKKGADYWTEQGFTMPMLLDGENTVAPKFGFGGIPTTIVVGPDGNVSAVHSGFSRTMVDELKKDVEAALASE